MNIHYHKVTGQIMSFDRSEVPDLRESHFPDHLVTFLLPAEGHEITINAKTQKIDVATEELVDKADDEVAHAHLPTLLEVQHVIATELQHSDSYVVPDRPLTDGVRAAWVAYRAALRALSKLPDAVAMVKAWPAPPAGADPIQHLRQRLPNEE